MNWIVTMANPLNPNPALLCKLGSIVRHVQEMQSPNGNFFDEVALASLLDDEAVVQWLADMDKLALLPVFR